MMNKKHYCSTYDLPLTLRIPDIAVILGVGRNTAYSLVKSGKIKSIRIGRQIRVPKGELLRFLTKS